MSQATQSADTTEGIALESAANRFSHGKGKGRTDGTYRNAVGHFIGWANGHRMETTADLGAYVLRGFNDWVSDKVDSGEWAPRTARTYSGAAREFVHFCERLGEGTPLGAHEHIERYELDPQDKKAELVVTPERAEAILRWLRLERPKRRETVIFWILAETGMRAGCGLRSIDLDDIGSDDDGDAFIHLAHRPKDERGGDQDDGMKKAQHERKVPITDALYEEIRGYVEEKRIEAEEPESHHGTRQPLITTRYHGEGRRASDKTIQTTVKQLTCPKTTGITTDGECECPGPPTTKTAGDCPLSASPHQIRGTVCVRLKDQGHSYEEMEPYLGATAETLRTTYDRAGIDRDKDRAKGLVPD